MLGVRRSELEYFDFVSGRGFRLIGKVEDIDR